MSCESSQNNVAEAAGHKGGIPKTASKFANYAGRILTPVLIAGSGGAAVAGSIYGGTKAINYVMNRVRETRAKVAAEKAAQARQKVALVKDVSHRQAALDIHSSYIGSGIFRAGLDEVLEKPQYTRLTRTTWLAEGANGSVVVDDLGDETYVIRGIGLELGKELELRNGLAAYSFRHPDLPEEVATALSPKPNLKPTAPAETRLKKAVRTAGQTANTIKGWLADNQEEVRAMAGTGFQAALLLAEMKVTGHRLSTPVTKLGYAYRAANLATDASHAIQKAKAAKLEAARLVETIRSPEYTRAAAALQKRYGAQVSRQNLESLMQARSQLIIDSTYKLRGKLGVIYYDQGENGQASIQRIMPNLGQELQLYRGMQTITADGTEKLTGQQERPERNSATAAKG